MTSKTIPGYYDLLNLSTSELRSLNRDVVDVLKTRIKQDRADKANAVHVQAGDRVHFTGNLGLRVYGQVTKVNRINVKVTTDDRRRWNVAKALLTVVK